MDAGRWATTIGTGIAAGAAGTLAMDLLWFRRSRAAGSDDGFVKWESSAGTESFDEVAAPAKVAQNAADVVGTEIPETHAGTTNDVVHWVTGAGWGSGAAALAAATGLAPFAAGIAAGAAAFAAAYTVLPIVGVYDPIWEYDGKTLWKDATAHLTFGAGTGLALGAAPAIVSSD